MYTFNKSEMDSIVLFLDSKIINVEDYFIPLQKAIKESMNNNYSDHVITDKLNKAQNIRDSIYLVDKHINNFYGIVIEKIEMFIYNYLKNDDDIITITNPDPSSKSDLIHIHHKAKYYFCSCGPDVKYGGPEYVVSQYIEKHLKRENSKGFIDITGYLNPDEYKSNEGFKKLTKAQNKKILKAVAEYGYKPAIPSMIQLPEYDKIFYSYLHYITTGHLPSDSDFEDIKKLGKRVINNEIKSSEIIENLVPEQNEIYISDINELFSEIKNRSNEQKLPGNKNKDVDYSDKNTETKRSKSNGKVKYLGKNRIWSFVKNNKGKLFIGFGALAIAIIHPKSRKYITKNFEKLSHKIPFVKKSSRKINIKKAASVIKDVAVSTIENKVTSSVTDASIATGIDKSIIIADKISSFSGLLKAFESGDISKVEFFEKAVEISKNNGKNVKRYLGLMVNFFHNKAAEELLR